MSLDLPLVIFDCDGVLVESESIANQILAKYLTELGAPHSVENCYADYRGLSMPSIIKKIEKFYQIALPDDFEFRLQAETYAAFKKNLLPIEGVELCIQQLIKNQVPICVASSGSYEKMGVTLGITGLETYFSGNIFSAEDVERGKPEPDLFLFAAKKMSCLPKRCVVVEDSTPGVQAGLAANMTVFAYCPSKNSKLQMESAVTNDNCVMLENICGLIPALQQKYDF